MNNLDEEIFFHSGKLINIRETRESDALIWYKWFNNPEINKRLIYGMKPNTIEEQIKFRNHHISGQNGKIIFSITEKENNKLIGTCSLNQIGPEPYKRCEISIVLGDKRYHSGPIYLEATLWQIQHAFLNLNMNSIVAGTEEENKVVIFTLERIGFKKVGILRQTAFKNGKYTNYVLYDLLISEWKNSSDYSSE